MIDPLRKQERAQAINILYGFRFQLFAIVAIIGIFIFLDPRMASADIEQSFHSYSINTGGTPISAVQTLGTGLTGTTSQVNLWGTGNYILQWFDEYSDSTYQTHVSSSAQQGGYIGSYSNQLIPIAITSYTFDPTKYYVLRFTIWDLANSDTRGYGTSSDIYTGGTANPSPCPAGLSGYCTARAVEDWYFNIVGATGGPIADGVISLTGPTGTVASSTVPVHFTGTYNNGNSETYDSIAFSLFNSTYNQQLSTMYGQGYATTTGNGIDFDVPLVIPLQGNYEYSAYLINTTTTGNDTRLTDTATSSFSYGSNATSTDPIYSAPEIVCSFGDLFCYMKKAFVWLLYPTDSVKNSFDLLKLTIVTKPPVGYFYILKDNLTGLTATSSAQVAVVIPTNLKTVIFDPLDVALTSILWALFGFIFYKRVSKIHL